MQTQLDVQKSNKWQCREAARKYLGQYSAMQQRVNSYRDYMDTLAVTALSTSSIIKISDRQPPTTSPGIAKYVELIEKYDELIFAAEQFKALLGSQIMSLKDGRFRKLLQARYIDEMQLSEIAKTSGYAYDWIRHLHLLALDYFYENVLKDREDEEDL